MEKHLAGALEPKLDVRVTREKLIGPGTETDSARRALIDRANLAVLLVSADFLASDDCRTDVKLALERHEARTAIVVPVICRACLWQDSDFRASPGSATQQATDPRWSGIAGCGFARCRGGLRALLPAPGVSLACPFPGLAFFDEDRAADFLGREAEIGQALAAGPRPARRCAGS